MGVLSLHRSLFFKIIAFSTPLLPLLIGAGLDFPWQYLKEYNCTYVIDGDTVILKRAGIFIRVRLADIDAPEIGQKAFSGEPIGNWSKLHLEKLILNKRVMFKQKAKDQYNRHLGTIFYKGKNINIKMVQDGHAIAYYYATNDYYRTSEFRAFINRVGIWKTQGMINPRLYRKKKKENESVLSQVNR